MPPSRPKEEARDKKTLIGHSLRNQRGSLLLAVVTLMVVLSLIGMGFLGAAVNNTLASKRVDNFERALYGGESAIHTAIETLKKQVTAYYAQMAAYRSSPSGLADYTQMYLNFFPAVRDAAEAAFEEPALTSYRYGDIRTETVFLDPEPLSPASAVYAIESVVTDGKVSRTVRGTLVVNRIDLTPASVPSLPYSAGRRWWPEERSYTGLNNGYNIYGNARVGALVTNEAKPWQFTAWNEPTCVDPGVIESIDWHLDFDAILAGMPSIPAAAPSVPLIANGAAVDTNYVLGRGGVFANPLNLIGQAGASFTVQSVAYPGGVIYSSGNLTISSGNFSSGGSIYIYCDGNLSISGVSLPNFTIYCGGNLTVNTGSFGTGALYCAGNVTMYSAGTIGCNVYAGGNITIYGGSFGQNMYCGGTFYCGGLSINNGLVYAEEGIHLGYDGRSGTISGVLYTNGNVYYEEGICITGQLVAKNNITLNPGKTIWPSVTYSAAVVNALLSESRLDAWLIGSGDSGGGGLPSQIVFGTRETREDSVEKEHRGVMVPLKQQAFRNPPGSGAEMVQQTQGPALRSLSECPRVIR